MHFKYEHLPNFCYRCGLLEHDLKECPESVGNDKGDEKGNLQYGAQLKGDPVRRLGGEYSFAKMKKGGDTKKQNKGWYGRGAKQPGKAEGGGGR